MSTKLLLEIENRMEDFIAKQCDQAYWPDTYVAPELASQMAQAAYAVFCASVTSQKFMESQES